MIKRRSQNTRTACVANSRAVGGGPRSDDENFIMTSQDLLRALVDCFGFNSANGVTRS
jgi:hypothetical protein